MMRLGASGWDVKDTPVVNAAARFLVPTITDVILLRRDWDIRYAASVKQTVDLTSRRTSSLHSR